ncbi:MAG: polysaccharide deacetylase family protein [Candidatus Omnitrophota bacterium]
MANKKRMLAAIVIIIIALSVSLQVFLNKAYRVPILMYHSVDYAIDKENRMFVSPEAFDRQMKFLRSRNYNVVTLEEAVEYLAENKTPPPRTVAITMDDGFADNYKYAYPVLKRYKIPATMFVVAGFAGREDRLSWPEIKEMSDSGVIDIESHTMLHPFLTGIDDNALKNELEDSKRILEEKLGKKVKFICYPMGVYDERVKSAAKKAGYEAGFATKPTEFTHEADIFAIKRIRISSTADNLFVFWIKVSGYHEFFKVMRK